jgi:hypothetical protein
MASSLKKKGTKEKKFPPLTELDHAVIDIVVGNRWNVLWTVMSDLGFVDSLGSAEYQRVTKERLADGRLEFDEDGEFWVS